MSAAACAVMSWVSGDPINSDRTHWKEWWNENAVTYQPNILSATEHPFGNGVIRDLGVGARGFVRVENDDGGNVWALIETERTWDKTIYRLYKFDRHSKEFAQTTMSRRYSSKGELPPPARFFRRVEETGIDFPRYHNGVWVSPNGAWGAAILGQESKYHSDSVVVLDFENALMRRPLRTDHQYASPVVSSDGVYVAVAKGWSWADPNTIVVIDTTTGKEHNVPIPPADDFRPIAFVDDSVYGPGYYLTRIEQGNHLATVWWCSPDGSQAKQVFAVPRGLYIHGDVIVTVDGARIFSSRTTADGNKQEYGWLQIFDGDFEPIIPSSMWPTSVDATFDGNHVVFIDHGKVYEWKRSITHSTKPGRRMESR